MSRPQIPHTDRDFRRFDRNDLFKPTAFHFTCKGALSIVNSRLRNKRVDLLHGVDLWKSLANAQRVCGIILTGEVLSSTRSESFGKVLVLLGVNSALRLGTRHVLAQQDQDRS